MLLDPSLPKKLRIKPGERLFVINAPEGYNEALQNYLSNAEVIPREIMNADHVQLFAKNIFELEHLAPKAMRALKKEGLLWISFPKGSSKVQTNLTRDKGWESLKNLPLKSFTLISVNDTWSAFGFKKVE